MTRRGSDHTNTDMIITYRKTTTVLSLTLLLVKDNDGYEKILIVD